MNCIIDCRENKIIQTIDTTFPFTTQQLPLGDFLIRDERQQEILVERKTWQDLHQSRKDGRYREQRSRLLLYRENNSNVKICYLIEGRYDDSFEIEKKLLLRLAFAYDIPVLYTTSLQDTVHFLHLHMKLDDLNSYFEQRTIDIDQTESRVKSCFPTKNYDNATIFFQSSLTSIRGVSPLMANSITDIWPTLSTFYSSFFEDPIIWKQKLKDIQFQTKKTKRKITENIINTIEKNFDLVHKQNENNEQEKKEKILI